MKTIKTIAELEIMNAEELKAFNEKATATTGQRAFDQIDVLIKKAEADSLSISLAYNIAIATAAEKLHTINYSTVATYTFKDTIHALEILATDTDLLTSDVFVAELKAELKSNIKDYLAFNLNLEVSDEVVNEIVEAIISKLTFKMGNTIITLNTNEKEKDVEVMENIKSIIKEVKVMDQAKLDAYNAKHNTALDQIDALIKTCEKSKNLIAVTVSLACNYPINNIDYSFDNMIHKITFKESVSDKIANMVKTYDFKKDLTKEMAYSIPESYVAKEYALEVSQIIADRLVIEFNGEEIALVTVCDEVAINSNGAQDSNNTTITNEEEGEDIMMNKKMMELGLVVEEVATGAVEFDLSMEAETVEALENTAATLEDEDVAFDLNADNDDIEVVIDSCDEVVTDGALDQLNKLMSEETTDEELADMGFDLGEDETTEATTEEATEETEEETATVETEEVEEVKTTNTNDEVKDMKEQVKESRVSELLKVVNEIKDMVLAEADLAYEETVELVKGSKEANKDAIKMSKKAKEHIKQMKHVEDIVKNIKVNEKATTRAIAKDAAKKALTNIETKALKTTLVKMGAKFPTELAAETRNDEVIVTNALTVLTEKFGSKRNGKEIIETSIANINKALASEEFRTLYVELIKKQAIKNSILVATVDKAVEMANNIVDNTNAKEILHTATIKTIFNRFRAPKLSVGQVIESRRKMILAKEQKVTLNVLKVEAENNDATSIGSTNRLQTKVSAIVMDENEAIRKGLITGSQYLARYGSVGLDCTNFSKDIIVMDLAQATEYCEKIMNFYVLWNGMETLYLMKEYDVDGEESYVDLTTGKVVELTEAQIASLRLFEVIGGSPSSLRKTQVLAFDITEGMAKIDHMLDALTEGAYTKEYNKQINAEQLAKYVTRFFAWTAPNKVIGTLRHAAVYFGKLANDKLDGAGYIFSKFYAKCMQEMTGIKVSKEDVLGFGAQCRPYSAKVFAPIVDESVFPVLCAESKGIVYIPEVTPEIDAELDKAFKGEGKYAGHVVVFGEEGCEPEFFSDLNGYKTVFNWGAETNMRVLDIAKSGIAHTSIQMWEVPMNNNSKGSVELMQKLNSEQMGEVYDDLFYKEEATVPSYVSLAKSYYAKDVISAVAPRYALDKDINLFRNIADDYASQAIKASNRFKWAIAGEYGRLTSDLALLVSEYGVLQYGEIFSPAANNFFDKEDMFKYVNCEARVKTMIGMRRVSMFKYPKMGVKEFYSATALTLENIIERINNLELKEDALKFGTERQIKDALINFYSNLRPGTVVVPGTDLLKQQCAGLDFDFDGASFIFDPRFNALLIEDKFVTNIDLKTKREKVVVNEAEIEEGTVAARALKNKNKLNSSIKKDDRVYLTAAQLKKAFLKYVAANSDGWNVGNITNCNSTQIAVLQAAKAYLGKDNNPYFDIMRKMLNKWFAKTEKIDCNGGSEKYVPLLTTKETLCSEMDAKYTCFKDGAEVFNKAGEVVGTFKCDITDVEQSTFATVKTVNVVLIDEVVERIKKADWNDNDNLLAIFEDLNDIFRFYQEVIIDSAKTGKMIKVKIAPGRLFHALEINNDVTEFIWNNEANEVFNIKVNKEAPSSKKEPIADLLFKVRVQRIEKDLKQTMDILIENKDISLSNEEFDRLSVFNNVKYKELNSQMVVFKKQYGDITKDWMVRRELAEDEDNTELLAQINKAYKKDLDMLGSAVLHAIKSDKYGAKFNDVNIGAYLAFVSNFNINPSSGVGAANKDRYSSQFGAKVLRAEYASYVIKYFGDIDFCGERIVYNNGFNDGDVVYVENGIAEIINSKGETKSLIVNANITGEFTIRAYKDDLYVTRPIVEVLQTTKEFVERASGEVLSIRANKEVGESVVVKDENGAPVVDEKGCIKTEEVNAKSFKDIFYSFKKGIEVEVHATASRINGKYEKDFGVYEVNEDGSLGRRLFNVDDCGSSTYRALVNGKRGTVIRKGYGQIEEAVQFFNCFIALK